MTFLEKYTEEDGGRYKEGGSGTLVLDKLVKILRKQSFYNIYLTLVQHTLKTPKPKKKKKKKTGE